VLNATMRIGWNRRWSRATPAKAGTKIIQHNAGILLGPVGAVGGEVRMTNFSTPNWRRSRSRCDQRGRLRATREVCGATQFRAQTVVPIAEDHPNGLGRGAYLPGAYRGRQPRKKVSSSVFGGSRRVKNLPGAGHLVPIDRSPAGCRRRGQE
jgi:hypothetical protein